MGKCVFAGRQCPSTNDPAAKWYCPAWSEGIILTNPQGEEKILHCGFEALYPALVEVIRAANSPVAAIEATRDEIVRGFSGLQALAAARVAQSFIEDQ